MTYFKRNGVLPPRGSSGGAPAKGSIVVSSNSLSAAFYSDEGAQALSAIYVTDGGPGTLAGVQMSITGSPWLTATLTRTGAGWTLQASVDTGVASIGANSGTIVLTDSNAVTSPVNISVSLTVTAATPTIALSNNALTLQAVAGQQGNSA